MNRCDHTEMDPDCTPCLLSPPGSLGRARDDLSDAIVNAYAAVPVIGPVLARRVRRRIQEARAQDALWIAEQVAEIDPELGARMAAALDRPAEEKS